MAELAFLATLGSEVCCQCGVQFAMPLQVQRNRREDHRNFFCPFGHAQHYGAETELDKFKRLYQQSQQLKDQIEAKARDLETSLRSAEAKAKRVKRRIENGVCPCCSRTFAQLQRHMRSQHPDYAESDHAKT